MRCTAQGFPEPSIQWLSAREILVGYIFVIYIRYDLELITHFKNQYLQVPTTDGVLKIASVRKSDEGEYTCTASNPSGTSTGRVNIFVRTGN